MGVVVAPRVGDVVAAAFLEDAEVDRFAGRFVTGCFVAGRFVAAVFLAVCLADDAAPLFFLDADGLELAADFFDGDFLRVGVAVAGRFFAAFSAAVFLPEEPFLPEDADAM